MTLENVEKPIEEAGVAETANKRTRMALIGARKGAKAAKQAAGKAVAAPSKWLDNAVYGTCYGIAYGTVFSSLLISKMLPAKGAAMKGFHHGAKVARKDFKKHEENKLESIDSQVNEISSPA
ncbi:MAG: hypothetical protein Kow0065_24290 [Methylomicrobium sp.]